MSKTIDELIEETENNLKDLEDKNSPSKSNPNRFTNKVEKMRQYYFGMIQGFQIIKSDKTKNK